MSMTDKERAHLQGLLGPGYDADRYARNNGGYEAAIDGFVKPKKAAKKTTKKAAKK